MLVSTNPNGKTETATQQIDKLPTMVDGKR